MRKAATFASIAIGVLLAGQVPFARADDGSAPASDAQTRARELLDEGIRLFTEEAAHESARDRFEAAFALSPSWQALNGIALTYQEQGRYVRAIETYRRLLDEFAPALTDVQRTTVERRLAALMPRVATIELEVDQEAVEISIDGANVGTGPLRRTLLLMPGSHALVATRERHEPLARTIDARAGTTIRVPVRLEPERVVVRIQPQRLARPMPTWIPWTTAGAGLGLVALGGLASYGASRDFAAFDRSVAGMAGDPPRPVRGDTSRRTRAELQDAVALGLYTVGGLTIATAIVLFARNQPRPIARENSLYVAPGRDGVAFGGTF